MNAVYNCSLIAVVEIFSSWTIGQSLMKGDATYVNKLFSNVSLDNFFLSLRFGVTKLNDSCR
jgi:hypothetical protein